MQNTSGQLRLNNRAIGGLIMGTAMLFMAGDCYCRSIEDIRTTDRRHGLYEIREEARKFMAEENKKNQTGWIVGDPNLKAQVARCAVPLKVKWAPESYELSGMNVLVYCTKIVKGLTDKNQWTMAIPVHPPLESWELPYYINEAARSFLKQTHPNWVAGSMNLKHMVGKCLEPLKTALDKDKSVVNVTCDKPVKSFFFKGDSWTVPVPIER